MASLKCGRAPMRIGAVITCAVVAACGLALSGTALGQEKGAPPPKETIFARKILMSGVELNMEALDTLIAAEKIDMADISDHADAISIMLLALPHMFPPSTNQWRDGDKDRDPALDTYASPDLWTNFADFYRQATAASKLALDLARTKQEGDVKGLVAQLWATCHSCHSTYLKTD